MNNNELEEYLKTIEPNFDSHIEKGTIEMSNEYYNLLEERMIRLLNENKQLKERIKYLERSNNRREDTIIGYRLEDIGIVAELEEWLRIERINNASIDEDTIMEVQLKVQELKEKYK